MLYREYLKQFIGKACDFNQSGGFPMLDVGATPHHDHDMYILRMVHEDFVILEDNPNRSGGTGVLATTAIPLSSLTISIHGR